MRKIENWGRGELLETLFVFESEEEREEYFRRVSEQIEEGQKKDLAELKSAYMKNSVIARSVRPDRGKAKAKDVFGSLNKSYMAQVRKIHLLYAGARSKLNRARETSRLESELQQVPAET